MILGTLISIDPLRDGIFSSAREKIPKNVLSHILMDIVIFANVLYLIILTLLKNWMNENYKIFGPVNVLVSITLKTQSWIFGGG